MSLRLAVDNESNVTPLNVVNERDVAGMLRELADAIERGETGSVTGAVILLYLETGPEFFGFGEDVRGAQMALGAIEIAKTKLIHDCLDGD